MVNSKVVNNIYMHLFSEKVFMKLSIGLCNLYSLFLDVLQQYRGV
jgi:hypothetical protein